MTTELAELDPCPLCGDPAATTWHAGSDNVEWACATCKFCGLALDEQGPGCMDRAAKRWNTRALASRAGGWREIESAPHQRKVLLGYRNKLGNWRTVVGVYYPSNTLEIDEFAGNWDELDEYAPAGWYESTETHEHVFRTDEEPTHWQPLPEPPAAPEPVGVG